MAPDLQSGAFSSGLPSMNWRAPERNRRAARAATEGIVIALIGY